MSERKRVTSGTDRQANGEMQNATYTRAAASAVSASADICTEREAELLSVFADRVLAVRRDAEGNVLVALCAADGADRAEFGTACEAVYGIYVADGEREIFLPDLARNEREALAVFTKFADGGVTPDTALEVADALLG